MAAPSTSARSHAAIAISHNTHSALQTGLRIRFAAGLRQIASGDDSEPRRQRLQQDRHEVRQHQHPQQLVAELRAAAQIGGPVAGIHVADADQIGRSGEGEHAAEHGGARGRDARVHLGQRGRADGLRFQVLL